MSSRKCPCGRALPLLERIEGRSNDSVVARDGRIINSLALIYAVREVSGIERFRIRQKHIDCFHIEVIRNQDFPDNGEIQIRQAWNLLLRSSVDITFEYISSFSAETSGKFRHVVSDLAAGQNHNRPQDCSVVR